MQASAPDRSSTIDYRQGSLRIMMLWYSPFALSLRDGRHESVYNKSLFSANEQRFGLTLHINPCIVPGYEPILLIMATAAALQNWVQLLYPAAFIGDGWG